MISILISLTDFSDALTNRYEFSQFTNHQHIHPLSPLLIEALWGDATSQLQAKIAGWVYAISISSDQLSLTLQANNKALPTIIKRWLITYALHTITPNSDTLQNATHTLLSAMAQTKGEYPKGEQDVPPCG